MYVYAHPSSEKKNKLHINPRHLSHRNPYTRTETFDACRILRRSAKHERRVSGLGQNRMKPRRNPMETLMLPQWKNT